MWLNWIELNFHAKVTPVTVTAHVMCHSYNWQWQYVLFFFFSVFSSQINFYKILCGSLFFLAGPVGWSNCFRLASVCGTEQWKSVWLWPGGQCYRRYSLHWALPGGKFSEYKKISCFCVLQNYIHLVVMHIQFCPAQTKTWMLRWNASILHLPSSAI